MTVSWRWPTLFLLAAQTIGAEEDNWEHCRGLECTDSDVQWNEDLERLARSFTPIVKHGCFQGVEEHVERECCHHLTPMAATAVGCFDGYFTRELCCATPLEVEAEEDEQAVAEPWRIDEECEAYWTAREEALHNLAPKKCLGDFAVGRGSRGPFVWNGVHVKARNPEDYFWAAAISSRCVNWLKQSQIATPGGRLRTEAKPKCQEVSHGRGRFELISPGEVWEPPNHAVAMSLKAQDGRSEVLPIVRNAREGSRNASKASAPSFYFLVLDSVSRSTFQKRMPLTYAFITSQALQGVGSRATASLPRSHEVFSFPRYHTLQFGGTMAQMFPVFFSGILRCTDAQDRAQMTPSRTYNISGPLQKCGLERFLKSVLMELRDAGYRLGFATTLKAVSGLLRSTRWDYVLPYMGKENIGDDADDAGNEAATDDVGDFVCTGGGRKAFELALSWAQQVLRFSRPFRGRPSRPHFVYVHLQAAHVNLQMVSFLDAALREHLQQVMHANPDLVIALASDHGALSRTCDQRSPMMHLLVPRSLLGARPGFRRVLRSNQEQVVSGWDLHATFRHLARFVEDNPDDVGRFQSLLARGIRELVISPLKAFQEVTAVDLQGGFDPRSFFQEMAPGRGCRGAGVLSSHCAYWKSTGQEVIFCVPWRNLSTTNLDQLGGSDLAKSRAAIPRMALQDLVCTAMEQTVIAAALDDIDRTTRVPDASRDTRVCALPTLKQLETVTSYGMGRFVLRMVLNEGAPNAVFDVSFELPSYRTRRVERMTITQVTRYRIHEACTPRGILAEFCLCAA